MLAGFKIDKMVLGGPAHNSGLLRPGDIITQVMADPPFHPRTPNSPPSHCGALSIQQAVVLADKQSAGCDCGEGTPHGPRTARPGTKTEAVGRRARSDGQALIAPACPGAIDAPDALPSDSPVSRLVRSAQHRGAAAAAAAAE